MKKVIKLTESDLARIVKRVLKEQQSQAPAQGNNQGGTQGGTPGRRYQISDFTFSTYLPTSNGVTFDDFVKQRDNFVGNINNGIKSPFTAYDVYASEKPINMPMAKEKLCEALTTIVVTPAVEVYKNAKPETLAFQYAPVRAYCVGYNKGQGSKVTNIKFKQINQNEASIIATNQSDKTFIDDAPYLIDQS